LNTLHVSNTEPAVNTLRYEEHLSLFTAIESAYNSAI